MIRRLILAACLLLAPLILLIWSPAGAMTIERVVSPGGIEAWLVQDQSVPLTAIEFRWRGGAALEPADRIGLASFATAMLREGAGELDGPEFARALEDLSIGLSFSASTDGLGGSLRALNVHRERAVELAALALAKPRFDADSIARVRSRILAGLARQSEEPRAVAQRALNALIWPGHPYARTLEATVAGTRAASADDMRGFLARRMARDNFVIGVVGGVTPTELEPLLDRLFGGLPATAVPDDVPETAPAVAAERVVVLSRSTPQATMLFAAPGLKRDDPDWFAALLVNWVLGGGGFSGRLMTEVREKRGLTYGVSTALLPYDRAGLISGSASTENSRAGQALDVIRAEWKRMGESGPTAGELEGAQAYLTGSFPLSLDSSGSIARLLVAIQYDRLGIDYLARRDGLINAVTLDDARRVAKRLYGQPGLLAVVVGQPDGITATEPPPPAN